MKNLFFFLLSTIVLGAFTGCSKPINPPEPPPVVVKVKQFTITATVIGSNGTISPTSAVVDSGKNIILTITPRDGFVVDTFKVNHTPVSLTSLSYVIYNVSSKQDIEVTFRYKYEVGTLEWDFTQFVWVEKSWLASIDNVIWWDFTDDSMKSTFWYNPDGTYDQLWNGHLTHGIYTLDKGVNPPTVFMPDLSYKRNIEFCDSTTMTIIFSDGRSITKITYTNDGVRRFK